jgi:chromosome segregation ATPase
MDPVTVIAVTIAVTPHARPHRTAPQASTQNMSTPSSSPARISRSAAKKAALEAVVPLADQLAPGAVPVDMTADEAAADAAKKAAAALEAGEVIAMSDSTELTKQVYIFNRDTDVSDELKAIHEAGCDGAEALANASKQQLSSSMGKLAQQQSGALTELWSKFKDVKQQLAEAKANKVIRIVGAADTSNAGLQAVLDAPTADKAQKIAQEKRLIAEQRALAAGEAQHAAANEGQEQRVARLEADLEKAKEGLEAANQRWCDRKEELDEFLCGNQSTMAECTAGEAELAKLGTVVDALEARVAAITKELEDAKGDAAVTGVQATGEALQQEAEEGLQANASRKRTRDAEAEASGLAAQAALGQGMQEAPKDHLAPPSGPAGPALVPLDQLDALAADAPVVNNKPTRGKGSGKKRPVPKDQEEAERWKAKGKKTKAENKRIKDEYQAKLVAFYENGGEELEEVKQENKKLKTLLKKVDASREELQDTVTALEDRLTALEEVGDAPAAAAASSGTTEADLKIELLQLQLARQKKHNQKLCASLVKSKVVTTEQIQAAFNKGKAASEAAIPIPDHLADMD